MKIKTFIVMLLGLLWGTGSWYWYTCQIKGFCDTPLSTLLHSTTPDPANVPTPADDTVGQTVNETSNTEPTAPEQNKVATNNENSANSTDEKQIATDEKTGSIPDDNPKQAEEKEVVQPTETTSPEEPAPEPEPDPEPIDNDTDGIPNAIETKLGLDANNTDTDNDGVNDFLETGDDFNNPLDTDGDGIINALDEDDDGDGDPTANEMPDPDNNGDPDDAQDIDANQIPDYLDPAISRMAEDDDGDGLNNGQEKLLGSNPTLTDSDGDGLSDPFEATDERDSDSDGTIDILDPDDDDDGIMTVMENADPNGDGNPDDALDSNNNGLPDYLDTDNTPTELPEPEQTTADTQSTSADETKSAETDANTDQTEAAEQPEEQSAPETTDNSSDEKATAAADEEDKTDATTETEQDTTPAEEDTSNKVTLDTSAGEAESDSIRKARLYFPFRSAEPELADDVVNYFELIIRQLKDNPYTKILVTGHTDSVGRGAANRRLGRERAEQVRDMLVEQGAPKAQILVESKGEGEPIADNQTDAGRKKNRRVEIEQVKE